MMELDNQSPEIIEYKAITGTFGEVRYFLTTLDHNDAAENIRFARDLQGKWGFSERVQRQLDDKRAETELFTYLAKSGIRFFNSLVVVLLPSSDEQREFWDFSNVISQGREIEKWVNLKLYKGVSRVVIDGQHRLLSLKKYWNIHIGTKTLSAEELAENCKCEESFDIPVVYLVFGNIGRVGYSQETDSIRDDVIKATRNIFTVINNTAKRIDRQTQLLLDDTKISALIPRKLLEEDVLEDKIVKWSSSSTNLSQSDPYLTTLDLISKCTEELLINSKNEALKKTFNSHIEREKALEKYYESHPLFDGMGTKHIFKWFFYELQPFKDWMNHFEHSYINVILQPEQTKLTTSQKEQIKNLRQSNVLYTVLGQRILFFAISRFLMRIKPEQRISATLNQITDSVLKMHDSGFFDRNASHWKNVIVQPNDKLTMITTGSGGEKCIELLRMIFFNKPDGVRELIEKTREDVDSEVDWTVGKIAEWRKSFHVELPEVKIDEDNITQEDFSDVNKEDVSTINNHNYLRDESLEDGRMYDENDNED
ncbi:DNA sulfur modification protein DndB [Synechocystis sp. PCC 7509]|uniref:DNA sulfur modification protein DndB n=1 Tax=Synechocystis sp. PCC 7509 TaxID=927677 RepID=UPI0002ABC11A|nr:DNA sulfur modification protein DndB [Synechocystis sp. PCC 7509]